MHPSILSKRKNKWQNLFKLWTTTAMGGRSSVSTLGERSDNDFSGPPSLLWSPWLELGAVKSDTSLPNSVLTQNYQSVLSTQKAVIKSSYYSNPPKQLP